MGLLSISYVLKKLYLPIHLHYFSLCFFTSPKPRFCKLYPQSKTFLNKPRFYNFYPQSKTFLNKQAVLISAVFCSNAVLITTPSSSAQFSSFFDVLPSAPTTTGITLILLMFHILLISLFSSWYLSIFSFSFSLILMSQGYQYHLWHNFSQSYSLQQYLVFLL